MTQCYRWKWTRDQPNHPWNHVFKKVVPIYSVLPWRCCQLQLPGYLRGRRPSLDALYPLQLGFRAGWIDGAAYERLSSISNDSLHINVELWSHLNPSPFPLLKHNHYKLLPSFNVFATVESPPYSPLYYNQLSICKGSWLLLPFICPSWMICNLADQDIPFSPASMESNIFIERQSLHHRWLVISATLSSRSTYETKAIKAITNMQWSSLHVKATVLTSILRLAVLLNWLLATPMLNRNLQR